jgi:hypothetical protein
MIAQMVIAYVSFAFFAVTFFILYKMKKKNQPVIHIFDGTMYLTWLVVILMTFVSKISEYLMPTLPFLVVMLYVSSRDYSNSKKNAE